MAKDYSEMSLDELKELKANQEKQDIIAELEAKKQAEKDAAEKEYKANLEKELREKILNEGTEDEPKVELNTDVNMSKDVKDEHVSLKTLKNLAGDKGIYTYEGFETGDTFNFEDPSDDPADTDCPMGDISDWEPQRNFVNAVWHTAFESANLLKVAVPGLDISKGAGNVVDIRTIERFERGDITTNEESCGCLSCSSTTVDKYQISLQQHGIKAELCEFDIWSVGEKFRQEWLKSLGGVWAEFFDYEIYNALEDATPGHNETVTYAAAALSGSCCTDGFLLDLYNAVDALVTDMRADYYKPDYMIMHPEIAATFRRMMDVKPIFADTIEVGKNGKLKSILGIEVIEYNDANKGSSAGTGDELIIVIDSRYAVGAAFGKRPTMESERNIDCNSTTYAMWCYFNAGKLEEDAIGHIEEA